MKGFAVLFAILGFYSQYANAAAVALGLTPVPEVEALADISRVERAETPTFDENNDFHAVREVIEDGISTNLNIAPRDKTTDQYTGGDYVFPWHGHMHHFVMCMYENRPDNIKAIHNNRDLMATYVASAITRCIAERVAAHFHGTQLKETYLTYYTAYEFPTNWVG
ncbi:hypothetical protein V494_08513 [Pseudogymnoascus sp. VKM F-4513 (FW-928)]|nr:hypothetical protein V494_08513 [Pseudogymnoascus sp. VKM F-4513 (FW-928)]